MMVLTWVYCYLFVGLVAKALTLFEIEVVSTRTGEAHPFYGWVASAIAWPIPLYFWLKEMGQDD